MTADTPDHGSDKPPPCFDCATDATRRLDEMFIGMVQMKRLALGQKPAERAVFRKLHGTVGGRLVMNPDRPEALRVGVFAKDELPAWVRFSSDTGPTSPDLNSTLGIGLKVWGVDGVNALGEAGDVADFIMQNFPVFFVDDAQAMCEFTYAGVVLNDYPGYLAKHPKTNAILNRMSAQVDGSVLTTQYWAILPFAFGPDRYAKYSLVPEAPPPGHPAVNVPTDDKNYLATDLTDRLSENEYRFTFMLQVVPKSAGYPLDKATEEWPTDQYPYQPVATLILPKQDVCARGQADYGQELAFNIWRTPVEQTPQGSIAAVRKLVYDHGAAVRHQANGQPLEQPTRPRGEAPPPPVDDCIVKAVIHPAIGVARIGNAPDGYFVGPEVSNPKPEIVDGTRTDNPYRDAEGRLLPQAARFRIYGVNAMGRIVRELTGEDGKADITWKVHLANKKSAWYAFQLALDIPEASAVDPSTLRNPTVTNKDREALVLDAGEHEIRVGHGKQSRKMVAGKFMHQGEPVRLGRMWCETDGRLLVTGGRGRSASYNGTKAITFGNNEGWHDDVSDGPVDATVTLNGVELPVTPAWIVVAPPNYGPQQKSVRTMWDLMRDVAIQAGTLPKPTRPSFTYDIYPVFERMTGLQWVNAGFAAGFGWRSANDFTSPDWIARLNDRSLANQETRRVLKNAFRHDAVDSWSPTPWPWVYGDAMNIPPAETPRQYTSLTQTQLAMLDQWVAGDFDDDWGKVPVYTEFDQVPLERQGEVLTKAALDFCLADAFHPGCEMTWPVRAATMYMEPFRFAHAPKGWVEPGMGAILSSDTVTIPNGPLYGQLPGGITRWMAVPWQTDTASCRSGYSADYDPYVPTFWPARVPNEVLTRENYEIVIDAAQPAQVRLAAFANRAAWVAPLGTTSYTDQINNMIHHFDHLGVVEVNPGPTDEEGARLFPPLIGVEDQHTPIPDAGDTVDAKAVRARHHTMKSDAPSATGGGGGRLAERTPVDLSRIDKVRRFPRGLRR
ncbi:LodA/GoxA family CTQ-dependent oxidase [Azospirillum thiophilum]|nr:LodA/GoxA family CTQ-dependent oxidase [Azospirillum thiophilum]